FLDAHAVTPDGDTDGALREEIERMLAADRRDGYLDVPLDAVEPPPPDAGPWRLIERVGRGGMGEVWRAERDAEFDQTAAVKLVRPGLGDALVARFRGERQILAGLDHPAIARLLDGGTASDGRPYLATEFVPGEPVTAWADRRRLGVNDRLALFTEVCEAVAYAHRRLVV
ncbi:MAG: protein kinase, partial [Pseudomonadota bacterium]